MALSKLSSYPNVSRFHATDGFLYIFSANKLTKLNDLNVEIWNIDIDSFGFSFISDNSLIVASGMSNHFQAFNTLDGTLIHPTDQSQLHPNQLLNSHYIITIDTVHKTNITDTLSWKTCWVDEQKLQSAYLDEPYAFLHYQKYDENWVKTEESIVIRDLSSGKKINSFNLPSGVDVNKLLGFSGNKFWIETTTGFIGFDPVSANQAQPKEKTVSSVFSNAVIAPQHQSIIQLIGHFPAKNNTSFIEYDTQTGEQMRHVLIEELEEKKYCFANQFAVANEKIYMTVQNMDKPFGIGIGVLDYKTSGLLDLMEVEDRNGTLNHAPVIDNDHLYILDSGRTLHKYKIVEN